MGQITTYDTAAIQKILDEAFHGAIQDVVGDDYTSVAPLAMTANTDYLFKVNGNTRNAKYQPPHVTNLWDAANSLVTPAQLLNTPEIVCNIQFTFDPTAAAAGTITLNMYVNETVPILMKSYTASYKATAGRYTIISNFYAGAETGFDVKNKGVFFMVHSSGNGELYDTAIEIYKT